MSIFASNNVASLVSLSISLSNTLLNPHNRGFEGPFSNNRRGLTMIQSLALYLDFEGAKNIHPLYVPIWGFGGCWRFLTGVWHLDLDLDMVTGL